MSTADQLRVLEEQLKMARNIEIRNEFIDECVDKHFGIGWHHRPTPQQRWAETDRRLGALVGRIDELRAKAKEQQP